MHYVKLLVGVAVGLLLYKMAIQPSTLGSMGGEYGQLAIQATSVIVAMMVVGMVL